jgi:hypothetical protein
MTPTALSTIKLSSKKPPAFRVVPGSLHARHGQFQKGAVLPETQVQACPKVKVADLPDDFLPKRFIEGLEQNQQIASCCRHPENHEVEARKSHPDEKAPDIYVFHCTCGRKHVRFCVGMDDQRPTWEAA